MYSHQLHSKNNVPLLTKFRHWSYLLSPVVKQGWTCIKKVKKLDDVNAILNRCYTICMPPKITQKTIITVDVRWWNLFDTFFRTLRGIFSQEWVKQWLQHRIQDLKHLCPCEISRQRIVQDSGMSWLTYCNVLILMISTIFDFVYYHHFGKLWNPP